MQKIINIFITISLILSALAAPAFASWDFIDVTVDGKSVPFDVQPQIIDNRTMVPMRAVCSAMLATVIWDDSSKSAKVTKDGKTIIMQANSSTYYVDDTPMTMDCAPLIIRGRMLLPARYIAENLGYTVDWDSDAKEVKISSSGGGYAYSGKNPKHLSDFAVIYENAEKNFYVSFGFLDDDGEYMRYHGTASIRIVNNSGEEVYKKDFSIEDSNFGEYTKRLTGNKVYLLTQIIIPQKDIKSSMNKYGTLYMGFKNEIGEFSEVSDMVINLPELRGEELADISYDKSFVITQDRITYIHKIVVDKFEITDAEVLFDDTLKVSYTLEGEIMDGEVCCIKANCYDKDGYLIDSDIIGGEADADGSFKIKDWMMISKDTKSLEFVAP